MPSKKSTIETSLPCEESHTNLNTPCVGVPATKKVRIAGNAMVLTSHLKFDTIQKLEKYNPKALCLIEINRDEEVEVFRISTGKLSSINKYGITFAEANIDGFATATILFPEGIKDKKEYIKDNFANTLFMLNDIEALVVRAKAEIDAAFEKLDADIEEM